MDARNYLTDLQRSRGRGETTPRFDFVYGDAFNDLGVPFHLTTEGFNEALRRIMHPDGVYLINIIDVYREGYGRFLGAYVGTILRTFPFVYVFSGDPEGTSQDRDTFVVVAAGRRLDLAELGQRPGDLEPQGTLFAWSEDGDAGGEMTIVLERGRGVVLTDDYAPVDNLLAPVFALQQEESE
jgi:hypothetical protein